MEAFISKEKLSKKAQSEFNKARRHTWGVLSPVTRRTDNKKAYNRKKVRLERDSFFAEPFDLSIFA